MSAYYNEIDGYAAQWLRNLMSKGLIPDGEVDTRSIVDVRADDLRGFIQCHFFAGLGGWPFALDRGGYPRDRFVWTGSCPCGPFSRAGELERFTDERHLWPAWVRLISEREPAIIFGEQVASATEWLRLVRGDLEALGYAVGTAPIEAASAGAYHLRDRYWFVADRDRDREQRTGARSGRSGETCEPRNYTGGRGALVDGIKSRLEGQPGNGHGTAGWPIEAGSVTASSIRLEWRLGADGKQRPIEPGICLVADGIPERVDQLRAIGNAIDPRPAAAFISAYLECRP